MKSIDEDIKNNKFKNIYFLTGVEPYLIGQYRDKLTRALIGSDDGLNLRRYSGESPDINEIIEYADTVPFFAARRVIILENTGLFKSSDDTLAVYLKDMPETTYVIFVECFKGERKDEKKYESTLYDKRYKLYKTVHELGRIVEFRRLDEGRIVKWLVKKFNDAGLNVTRRAMDCFLEYVGDDMNRLSNEAEKLICYRLGHSSVDEEDVKAICSKSIDNDIFEMVSALASKNKKKAFELYYDLVELKVRPINIISLITREFNLLMQVKAIRSSGAGNKEITDITKIKPYFVGKYVNVSGRFTAEYLREAVTDCVNTDAMVKQGRLNEVAAVEMLLIKYSA